LTLHLELEQVQKMMVHTPTNELGEERHRTGAKSREENGANMAADRTSAKTVVDPRCVFTAAKSMFAKTAVGHRCVFTAAKRVIAKTAVGHRCVFTTAKRVTAKNAEVQRTEISAT
jgi:hypothetical protein